MSTYVGSRGGVYRGNAPAEDCEAMERWNARCELGAEIKAKVAGYGAQSALARACGVTPACISNVLDGSRAPSGAAAPRASMTAARVSRLDGQCRKA